MVDTADLNGEPWFADGNLFLVVLSGLEMKWPCWEQWIFSSFLSLLWQMCFSLGDGNIFSVKSEINFFDEISDNRLWKETVHW